MVKEVLIHTCTLEFKLIWVPPFANEHSSSTVTLAQLHVSHLVTSMYITMLNNSETTTLLFVSFLPVLCVNHS